MSYLNYKKRIEFSEKQYIEIDKFCKKIDIEWFASAWDKDSVIFLRKFNLKYHKISSAMITNYELLDFIAKEKKLLLFQRVCVN